MRHWEFRQKQPPKLSLISYTKTGEWKKHSLPLIDSEWVWKNCRAAVVSKIFFFAIQYAYHSEYKARCHSGYQITCFEFRYSIQLLCVFFCFALIEFHLLFKAFELFASLEEGNYILIEIGFCRQAVSTVFCLFNNINLLKIDFKAITFLVPTFFHQPFSSNYVSMYFIIFSLLSVHVQP